MQNTRWRERWIGPGGLLAVVTVLGAITTYATSHQIFPDSQYYILRTEVLLGMDPHAAERTVREYVRAQGAFEPYPTLWGWERGVAMYRPRVLLPVLSMPFVALFGPGGIVVVPALAYAVFAWATYQLCRLHVGAWTAALVVSAAVSSVQVRIWGLGGLTESLAMAAVALLLLLLPWHRPVGPSRLVGIAAFAVLAGTARVTAPFTAGTGVALWIWSRRRGDPATRRSWTWAVGADLLGSAVGVVFTSKVSGLSVADAVFAQTRTRDWPAAVDALVVQVPHILWQETTTVLGDWPLSATFLLVAVGVVLDRSWLAAWLVVSSAAATLVILVLNAAYTEFRYPMPAVPALALAAAVGAQAWREHPAGPAVQRGPSPALGGGGVGAVTRAGNGARS